MVLGDGFRQSFFGNVVKRVFDVVVSSVLLLVCLPVLLIAAVCIYLESGAPVLYRQERAGRGGRVFTLYKLRSMRRDAERHGRAQWATANDDRTTRVGRFLWPASVSSAVECSMPRHDFTGYVKIPSMVIMAQR